MGSPHSPWRSSSLFKKLQPGESFQADNLILMSVLGLLLTPTPIPQLLESKQNLFTVCYELPAAFPEGFPTPSPTRLQGL